MTKNIIVTDLAFEKIKAISEAEDKVGFALRVAINGGGCSGLQYVFSFVPLPEEKDLVVSGLGQTVVVDPKSLLFLNGSILDWTASLMKTGFVIRNPNEKTNCSCGKSFGV